MCNVQRSYAPVLFLAVCMEFLGFEFKRAPFTYTYSLIYSLTYSLTHSFVQPKYTINSHFN